MADDLIKVDIVADYDDKDAKKAKDDLEAIDGRKATATVDADIGAGLTKADADLDALDGRTATATVDADIGAGLVDADADLDALDGRTVSATVDADIGRGLTRAEDELDDIDGRTVSATVDADIGSGLADADGKLDDLDGRTVSATVDADIGTGLTAAEGELDTIDGRTAKATVDASIGTGLTRAEGELDAIDGRTVKATVDADTTSGAEGLLTRIGGLPGAVAAIGPKFTSLAAVGGPIAAVGGALIAAADEAADLASEAQTIADLSGTSVENASALSAVLRDNTNIEAGDLMDIMAQVTGALASNPSLMQQLGIKMDTVRQGPFATFIAAVDAWNSGQLTGTEKMLAGAQLFGEEGLRQIGALTTALDTTLADAVAGVAENRLIHPEDVVSAQELKRQISGLTADFQTMAVNIGQQVVPVLADMLGQLEDAGGLVNTIAEIGQTGTARSVWDFINEFPSAKFVEINDQLNAAGVTAEDFRKNLFDLNDVMALLAAGIPAEVIEGATLTADAQKYLAEQVAETTDAAEDEADALEDTSKTLQSYTDRLETSIDALELQADAQREAAAASEEQADALLAANDTFYANQKAIRAARDAVHDYNDVAADSESSADDQAEALQNVALAAADVAATEVEALRRIRETTGATVSQTEALDITNRSLLNQAANLQGPARDAIVAHIARLNGIPIETITNILAIADAGNIGVAEATLDEASRTRTATVKADTDNASVANTDKELNNLARRRDAQIAVELLYKNLPTSTFLGTYGVRSRGASAPAPPPAAVTPYGAGIAGGGDVYNLTLPRGTRPDDMARALTRHARRNGRPYAFR